MKRGMSSRKGVSGLIAAIILFAMLFTTGAAYIMFVTESQFNLQDATKDAFERDIERKSETLSVETSKLADGDLGVSITNTGAVPVQVEEILVLDSDGLLIKDIRGPTLPITLNAQELTATTIDTNVTIESGASYAARIITGRGTLVSTVYPPEAANIKTAVSSEIAKAIGSVAMDTTTLQYSQDGGTTWNEGWSVPGGIPVIWRVNVTNMVARDIYLSNYSSFLFLKMATGGGGQLQPKTFYITTAPTANTYPNLEDPDFLANGGVMLPANGTATVAIHLKLSDPGSGSGLYLDSNARYHTILELFGKYDSPTSNSYYGQSLPFVGVLSN
ncbi:MAG: hypothetical protein ACE5KU_00435 [Nitrososphaerales archaeon]